ncbi:MAG: hypothetical protein H0W71_10070 [Sphingomonas sp.]|nr:hypothetical protein [Sphingomonas sp.]
MTTIITWKERVANLTYELGREPTLGELLEAAWIHEMTPEEIQEQRRSLVRNARCEHGEMDFEQCPKCREQT